MFVVASIEGCLGTAKKSQDGNYFQTCISQLEQFLNSLKQISNFSFLILTN